MKGDEKELESFSDDQEDGETNEQPEEWPESDEPQTFTKGD
jgi:hypothetical protein